VRDNVSVRLHAERFKADTIRYDLVMAMAT
jgi:hypothetical protein